MKKLVSFLLLFLILMQNSLASLHQESPMTWKEYSLDAFEQAKKENKPVFMLVTASWCSSCHLFQNETLNAQEVSSFISERFIPILVDADQRKDLADEYLADALPGILIFDAYGHEVKSIPVSVNDADILDLLQRVISPQANEELTEVKVEDFSKPLRHPSSNDLLLAVNNFPAFALSQTDVEHGGFQGKKSTEGGVLLFMLEHYERTQDSRYLAFVEKTLQRMAHDPYVKNGINYGLFDSVEGGFHRFATEDWSEPQYEKMLVDQARMIPVYLKAYELTGNLFYKGIAERTLLYALNNLYDPETAFYGSQDAVESYYKLTLDERKGAGKPNIGKTVYSDGNAEMIIALAYAAEQLGRPELLEKGEHAADFFLEKMITDKGVMHYYDGSAKLDGLVQDNAEMIRAFLYLHEKTGKEKYFLAARELQDHALENLYDSRSGGFVERNSTSMDLYPLGNGFYGRHSYGANGVMALNLLKLYDATQELRYLTVALETLGYSLNEPGSLSDSISYANAARYLTEHAINLEVTEKPQAPFSQYPFFLLILIAFLAGMFNFASLSSLPAIQAYAASTFENRKRTILRNSLAFFLGLALVFSLLGASSTALGSFLLMHSILFSRISGTLVLVFGFYLLLGKGFSPRVHAERRLLGNFLFGAGFGFSWSPLMGPVLSGALILASSAVEWHQGIVLLFAYAFGFALPFLILSRFLDKLHPDGKFWRFARGKMITLRFLGWEAHSTRLLAGLLFVLLGFFMMNGYLHTFTSYFLTTDASRWIFSLEEKLLTFLGR